MNYVLHVRESYSRAKLFIGHLPLINISSNDNCLGKYILNIEFRCEKKIKGAGEHISSFGIHNTSDSYNFSEYNIRQWQGCRSAEPNLYLCFFVGILFSLTLNHSSSYTHTQRQKPLVFFMQ